MPPGLETERCQAVRAVTPHGMMGDCDPIQKNFETAPAVPRGHALPLLVPVASQSREVLLEDPCGLEQSEQQRHLSSESNGSESNGDRF